MKRWDGGRRGRRGGWEGVGVTLTRPSITPQGTEIIPYRKIFVRKLFIYCHKRLTTEVRLAD
jgi:hypothetical protein